MFWSSQYPTFFKELLYFRIQYSMIKYLHSRSEASGSYPRTGNKASESSIGCSHLLHTRLCCAYGLMCVVCWLGVVLSSIHTFSHSFLVGFCFSIMFSHKSLLPSHSSLLMVSLCVLVCMLVWACPALSAHLKMSRSFCLLFSLPLWKAEVASFALHWFSYSAFYVKSQLLPLHPK